MPATTSKARWNSGNLLVSNTAAKPSPVYNIRIRSASAAMDAGVTILSAVPGVSYRLIQCSAIAIGGAAGGLTTVDVKGTQSTSVVSLVAYAQANLTQSTELRAGDTGGVVLADGASYAVCDVNTAITAITVGSAITTATSIDIILEYAMEHA